MLSWIKGSLIECSHIDVFTTVNNMNIHSKPLFVYVMGKKSGRSYAILKRRTPNRADYILSLDLLSKCKYNWLNIRGIYIKNILHESNDILNVRHDVHRSVIKVRSK